MSSGTGKASAWKHTSEYPNEALPKESPLSVLKKRDLFPNSTGRKGRTSATDDDRTKNSGADDRTDPRNRKRASVRISSTSKSNKHSKTNSTGSSMCSIPTDRANNNSSNKENATDILAPRNAIDCVIKNNDLSRHDLDGLKLAIEHKNPAGIFCAGRLLILDIIRDYVGIKREQLSSQVIQIILPPLINEFDEGNIAINCAHKIAALERAAKSEEYDLNNTSGYQKLKCLLLGQHDDTPVPTQDDHSDPSPQTGFSHERGKRQRTGIKTDTICTSLSPSSGTTPSSPFSKNPASAGLSHEGGQPHTGNKTGTAYTSPPPSGNTPGTSFSKNAHEAPSGNMNPGPAQGEEDNIAAARANEGVSGTKTDTTRTSNKTNDVQVEESNCEFLMEQMSIKETVRLSPDSASEVSSPSNGKTELAKGLSLKEGKLQVLQEGVTKLKDEERILHDTLSKKETIYYDILVCPRWKDRNAFELPRTQKLLRAESENAAPRTGLSHEGEQPLASNKTDDGRTAAAVVVTVCVPIHLDSCMKINLDALAAASAQHEHDGVVPHDDEGAGAGLRRGRLLGKFSRVGEKGNTITKLIQDTLLYSGSITGISKLEDNVFCIYGKFTDSSMPPSGPLSDEKGNTITKLLQHPQVLVLVDDAGNKPPNPQQRPMNPNQAGTGNGNGNGNADYWTANGYTQHYDAETEQQYYKRLVSSETDSASEKIALLARTAIREYLIEEDLRTKERIRQMRAVWHPKNRNLTVDELAFGHVHW